MKAIVCEMCGSPDLIKQDGVYVCQNCGTKYSVEEAKKLMVEGVVKIDDSDELKNLYVLARRAKEASNYVEAAKYYDMILVKDSSSWEANFFSVFFKAMTCKIAEISSAANSVNNCIESTFELIEKNILSAEERMNAILIVKNNSFKLSEMLCAANDKSFNETPPSIKNNYIEEHTKNDAAATCIKSYYPRKFLNAFSNDDELMKIYGVDYLKTVLKGYTNFANEMFVEKCERVIRKYEPSYTAPDPLENLRMIEDLKREMNITEKKNSSSGGCYVATAVYGSYDCPQVWTLRRYRDYALATTWYGRAFIRTYYAVSPTLVKWFGQTKWFKKMWKGRLDHMIAGLRDRGYDSSPYFDKKWY